MRKSTLLMFFVFFLVSGCITIEKQGGLASGGATVGSSEAVISSALTNPTGYSNFNVEIDLPKSYQKISPGNELWFTTKLMNLNNQQRIDVTLTYQILDSSRILQYSKSETVAVETQASFVANLQTPLTLKPEKHYLHVILNSPYGQSEAENTFEVALEETPQQIVIKFSLFDIEVEIPREYKAVQPGEELLTTIKLINVGSGGRIDIFLDYWITDERGGILLEEKETVAVETQNDFVRFFDIPETALPGKYTFHAKVSYPGLELNPEYATTFTITNRRFDQWLSLFILGGSVFLLGILLVNFRFFKSYVECLSVHRKVRRMVKRRSR